MKLLLPLLTLLPFTACAAGGGPGGGPGGGVGAPSPAIASLNAVVDSVMSAPPLHRTHWGVLVTDAATGRVLVDRNAHKLFSTASNAKLPTVAAGFELLGPDYRWRTELAAVDVRDGVASRLVVRGSGDPSLSRDFHHDPLAVLDSMADSLARAGIRRIDGPLVVDQSRFDSLLVHPAWEHFDLDWYYAAPVAPFAVLRGAYPVVVTPGAPGSPAAVEALLPEGLVALDARVMTVEGGRGWNDDLRRVAGTDSLIMRGTIGVEAGPDTSWIAQDDPGRFAGRALAMALARRGIPVAGGVRVTTAPEPTGAGYAPTVTWSSPSYLDVARMALEQSDNWITEQVLKTLGAERDSVGSWSRGTAVVESFLDEQVGVAAGSHYLRDGSGLTSQTLMTPDALVALLDFATRQPWYQQFRDAMVAPGEPQGTMEQRLLAYQDRLVAKTGTLTHVNALSGYARVANGDTLLFSILTTSSGQPARLVREAVDMIVDAMINRGR